MSSRFVLAAIVVVPLLVSGCTPTAKESPTPSATNTMAPTPTVSPTPASPAWSAEQLAAVETVERWFGIYNEVLRRERDPNDLASAARGDVLADAQRTFNQFGLANLTVEGDVAISDLSPSELSSGERPTVRVDLCQDTTGWRVLDEDGKDTLTLDAKVVRPLVAAVEEWPEDGWFVTSLTKGERTC